MISAFGVEHIHKSYVPGKGFVAAAELSAKQQGKVLQGVERSRAKRLVKGTPERRALKRQKRGWNENQLYPGVKTQRGKLTKVTPKARRKKDLLGTMNPDVEGYSLPNGRGGGRVKVFRDAEDPEMVLRHEMAHVAPRRNIWRLNQRANNPVVVGREEGRADFIAHGNQVSPDEYPGGKKFQRGYAEVQNKMAAARQKRTP